MKTHLAGKPFKGFFLAACSSSGHRARYVSGVAPEQFIQATERCLKCERAYEQRKATGSAA